mgnify:CR=1 FL=1|jgi:hypothetical protein|tara:strand:- start:7794 stop:7976 length:183 start_codon:yes stop_codon:yes gene_type:complete
MKEWDIKIAGKVWVDGIEINPYADRLSSEIKRLEKKGGTKSAPHIAKLRKLLKRHGGTYE